MVPTRAVLRVKSCRECVAAPSAASADDLAVAG